MTSEGRAIFDTSLSYSPASVAASQTAVLLLDYQNFILGLIPDAAVRTSVLEAAVSTRAWAIAQGIPVYHCLIDLDEGPLPHAKLTQRWPMLKGMLEKNPGVANIASPLDPKERTSEKVTRRKLGFLSALSSPDLAESLKANNVQSLIICGVSTSAVVLSTARAANELGYHVTVVHDACFDPQVEVHQALIKYTLPTSAHVVSREELTKAWKLH